MNQLSRTASILAVSAISSMSSAQTTTVFDSFEQGSVGTFPADWSVRFSGGGTEVSDSVVAVGSKSLWMKGNAFFANEIYTDEHYYFSDGKSAALSFSIYVDAFDMSSDGCAGTHVRYHGTNGVLVSGIAQEEPGGPLMIRNTGIEAQTKTWYHFSCFADYANGTMDIYVNGELVRDDAPMNPAPDDVRKDRLVAHTGCTDSGSVISYVDQISLHGDPCQADVNNDGVKNFFDVSRFIDRFNASCD
jgi:hypothetical protein